MVKNNSPHELVDFGHGHAARLTILQRQRDEARVGIGRLGKPVLFSRLLT